VNKTWKPGWENGEGKVMRVWMMVFVWLLLLGGPVRADSFNTIAGIELGTGIEHYWDLLYEDTATEIPDVLFIKEVKLKPGAIPGVRGGSLSYTVCSGEKRVARVKLKFADRSEKLFKDLDRLYRNTWGKPDQWQGDAFKNVQAWQWVLGKGGDEEVEVVLMYSKVDDMRPGVSIKMTLTSLWEQERECWERQRAGVRHAEGFEADTRIRNIQDFVPH
jgi:hypothetical protein